MINRFFEKITDALGTNEVIIAFAAIAVIPLYFQLPHTVLEWQNWLSQTCIQLIALAILQKGTRVEGERQSRLIKETHDAAISMRQEENQRSAERHNESMEEVAMIKKLCANCAFNDGSE